MSDSGTVELSRDCGEEGTRHMPCHGKEDRNTILNELTCIDDTENNDNLLKTTSDLLVDIHQKSVELIKAVSSDNKEDNNIDGVMDDGAKGESKASDRLKLNLDDVMMGDQPMAASDENVELKTLSKTDKKLKKKADGDEKYLKKINKKKLEKDESDELMMGDQPANDDTISTVVIRPKEVTSPPTIISTTSSEVTETMVSSTTILSTTETRLRRETEISVNEAKSTDSSVFTTQLSIPTTTNSPAVKISNKSTLKPRGSDEHASTVHHQKDMQEAHLATDHFIPPMLLVRTQFSLSNGHGEHVEAPRKHIEEHEVSTASSNDASAHIKASTSVNLPTTTVATAEITTAEITTAEVTTAEVTTVKVTTPEVTTATIVSTTEKPIVDITSTQKSISESSVASIDTSAIKLDASTTVAPTTLLHFDDTTKLPTSEILTANEQIIDLKKTTESTNMPVTEPPRFRQPHAPKHSSEFHSKTPTTLSTLETSYPTTQELTTPPSKPPTESVVTEHPESINTVTVTTSSPIVYTITENSVRNNCSSNLDISSDKPIEQSKRDHSTTVKHHSTAGNVLHSDHNLNDHLSESIESDDPCWTEDNSSADLSNSDVFQPYRPNRRRVLTKPESHSYIKKVLG